MKVTSKDPRKKAAVAALKRISGGTKVTSVTCINRSDDGKLVFSGWCFRRANDGTKRYEFVGQFNVLAEEVGIQ